MNLETELIKDITTSKKVNVLIPFTLCDFLNFQVLLGLNYKENLRTFRVYENRDLYFLFNQIAPTQYILVRYWEKENKSYGL